MKEICPVCLNKRLVGKCPACGKNYAKKRKKGIQMFVYPNSAERMIRLISGLRPSVESSSELSRVAEDYMEKIVKRATEMAIHAGRKTIKKEDIKLAAKWSNER